MSELIGTLLDLTSVLGQVQENAPLIAAAAAVPMLSLASWRLVSKRALRENYRSEPRPISPTVSDSSVLEDVPEATRDALGLYRQFARKRQSQLIVLPAIDEEDRNAKRYAEARALRLNDFLFVYRQTPSDTPIDILLSANLDLDVTDVKCISNILKSHPAKVSAIIPFQAFGPTCLLAFAVDEVRMARDATLAFDNKLTKATLRAASIKGRRNMSDKGLLELHGLQQAVRETEALTRSLLADKRVKGVRGIAKRIAGGEHTWSNPIRSSDLAKWGLPVQTVPFIEHYELPPHPVLTMGSAERIELASTRKIAPTCSEACPIGDTRDAMSALEAKRNSRIISVIHAPGMGSRSVDSKTTAEALKAIRKAAPGTNLDIILNTPGGSALGAEQLARALKEHKGRITFFVPYQAFSAGTYLALTGHEIFLSKIACLGPIDAQLGLPSMLQTHEGQFLSSITDLEAEKEVVAVGQYLAEVNISQTLEQAPAAAIASLLKHKSAKNIDDDLLKHVVDARSCIKDDHKKALALMSGNYSRRAANRIAHFLNDGTLSHGYPVQYDEAKKIGLHVSLGIPPEVYTIVDNFLFAPGGFCSVIHCSGEDDGAAA